MYTAALGTDGDYARYMETDKKDPLLLETLHSVPAGERPVGSFRGQLHVRLQVSPGPKMLHRARARARAGAGAGTKGQGQGQGPRAGGMAW